MKKTVLILMMMVMAVTASAQTVGDAFYIYRNDGGFNAFFREEVDSIVYSNYDSDSIYYDDVVTQVIYTPDSVYRIPLAAIDSVGFVQPETIYEDDVRVLEGELYDYVVAVEDMNITMSISTPERLLPKEGDKIATVELSDKFPYGFFGQVKQVLSEDDGITLYCDSIPLEDVVVKFYGMVEMGSKDGGQSAPMQKAPGGAKYFVLDLPEINVPVDLSGYITKKKIFDIEGKASFNIKVQPDVRGKISYAVDKTILLSYVNIHTTSTLYYDADIEIAGVAKKELKKNLLPPPLSDPPLPYGIPLHIEIGPKLELNGEFGVGFSTSTSMTCVQDITYRPLLSLSPVTAPFANKMTMNVQRGPFNMDWKYVAGRGTFKGGAYLRLGLSLGKGSFGFVGGEVDGPFKGNIEFYFDIDRLQQADKSTALYDEIKDLCKLDANPYLGVKFIASIADDKYRFEIPKDFEIPGKWFSGRLLPEFSNVKSRRLEGQYANAEISASIAKACPIPYTIGYTLLDKEKNKISDIYGQKYSIINNFTSYKMTVKDIYGGKEYKCYPMIKLFGYDMLASPECDLEKSLKMNTNEARNITEKGAQLDGSVMNYNPELDKGECGFFYNKTGNPTNTNGTQVYVGRLSYFSDGIFLSELSDLEKNTTYYYCSYYYTDGEYIYGETKSFKTKDGLTYCPDGNHPHMIDLGLPSGTKWACCNVGATKPEDYGGYYHFGEVSSAPSLDQIKELLNKCSYSWATLNGVRGGKFKGPNGGTIFLPAAGLVRKGELYYVGSYGDFWSSTPSDEYYAYYLYFCSTYAGWYNDWSSDRRYYELSVRPVR